jgi:O-antigen ligase
VTRRGLELKRENFHFWAMLSFTACVFLMGGGARGDVQSLILLRPIAAVFLALGLWHISWDEITRLRGLFLIGLACLALVLIHLIPLPPSLWQSLPGRDLVMEIDRAAGLGAVWRPLTLTPAATWNAAYALLIPITALVLLSRLSRTQLAAMVPVLLVLGFISGLLGLAQAVGPMNSPLYLYRITNNGLAVGLFANRNHQAVLLATLLPMLAVYASVGMETIEKQRFRFWLALGGAIMIIPLLLATGSRAGLIVGAVGLLAMLLIYRRPANLRPAKRKTVKVDPRIIIATVVAAILGVLIFFLSRAEAVNRLLDSNTTDELRFAVWPAIMDMGWKYFPVGSGFGSFVEAFQIDEPYETLRATYMNHAHNDWLEIFMTGGLPALLILFAAIFAWGWRALALVRTGENDKAEIGLARLGATVIAILAAASVADYPLRTPILALVFVTAAVWMMQKPRLR